MSKLTKMTVQGTDTVVFKYADQDYVSLTDIARYKDPDEPKDIVKNWMRTKNTIEFLGLWETVNNPDFKGVEFDSFYASMRGLLVYLVFYHYWALADRMPTVKVEISIHYLLLR